MNDEIIDNFFKTLLNIKVSTHKETNIGDLLIGSSMINKNTENPIKDELFDLRIYSDAMVYKDQVKEKFIAIPGSIVGFPLNDTTFIETMLAAGFIDFKGLARMLTVPNNIPFYKKAKVCRIKDKTYWCHCFELQPIIERYIDGGK